jgi:transposase-like protein
MWTFKIIPASIKETILKQIKEDWRNTNEVALEFSISPKTIYNWLRKDVDETWISASQHLTKIHRLEKEKQDLIQIIWALSVVVERMKKKDKEDHINKRNNKRKF